MRRLPLLSFSLDSAQSFLSLQNQEAFSGCSKEIISFQKKNKRNGDKACFFPPFLFSSNSVTKNQNMYRSDWKFSVVKI